MAIDHVGYVFFPNEIGFRIVGRLSFPLFAWLLVQGEAHTRSVPKYALRLFGLGLISQPLYRLAFDGVEDLNILFTLLLGLGCLRLARLYPQWQLLTWVCGCLLAGVTNVDYGGYGIAVIALLWKFQPEVGWWLGWGLLHFVLVWIFLPELGSFQAPAVLAPLFVQFANHQSGKKARWFYLFYPLHLLVLLLIKQQLRL